MDERAVRERVARAMHVGVVHGGGGIHFLAVADTRGAMLRKVAGYVRAQAAHQLYAADAAIVADLLERSEADAAVRYYFEHVGARWDRETLTLDVVPLGRGEADAAGAWC